MTAPFRKGTILFTHGFPRSGACPESSKKSGMPPLSYNMAAGMKPAAMVYVQISE